MTIYRLFFGEGSTDASVAGVRGAGGEGLGVGPLVEGEGRWWRGGAAGGGRGRWWREGTVCGGAGGPVEAVGGTGGGEGAQGSGCPEGSLPPTPFPGRLSYRFEREGNLSFLPSLQQVSLGGERRYSKLPADLKKN